MTKNFKLEEFTRSDTSIVKGIKNVPNESQIINLKSLVTNLLQPIRELYGRPMKINSGFRSEELNKAVGGSATSDHRFGNAADVKVDNPKELFDIVINSGLQFDQLILYPTFIHLSYRKFGNRKQISYDSAKTFRTSE